MTIRTLEGVRRIRWTHEGGPISEWRRRIVLEDCPRDSTGWCKGRTGRFYQAGGSLSPAPSALLWGVLPPKSSKYKWSTYLRPPCWGLSSAWWAQTRRACFPAPQRSVFRVVSPFEIMKFRKSLIEMLFAVPNIVRPRGVRGASKQGQGDGVGVWL